MAEKHVISSAREFAERAEQSSGGGQSVLPHLDEIAVLVRGHGELHQTVAYLHHVLEGGSVTLHELEEEFGALVASCVALLSRTHNEDPKESRRRRYAELAVVKVTEPAVVALVVATADRLSRVQDCYLRDDKGCMRRFRQDHRDFRQAVFRPAVADKMWHELTELISW